jgi:hypothetical protein
MFFNEYELMKLRQNGIEKKARNAWMFENRKKISQFQKIFHKWSKRHMSAPLQQNCECSCQC